MCMLVCARVCVGEGAVALWQVAAGLYHTCAIRADTSKVECWGRDNYGQASKAPTPTGFTQVAGGGWHSLALCCGGAIDSWGKNNFGQAARAPAGSGFLQVAGSGEHSLALVDSFATFTTFGTSCAGTAGAPVLAGG